jgi:uncharacterized membrane protein
VPSVPPTILPGMGDTTTPPPERGPDYYLRHLNAHREAAAIDSRYGAVAEKIAAASVRVPFMVGFVTLSAVWMITGLFGIDQKPWAVYTLVLSLMAIVFTLLVLLAQGRAAVRDAAHAEATAAHVQEEMDALRAILAKQDLERDEILNLVRRLLPDDDATP